MSDKIPAQAHGSVTHWCSWLCSLVGEVLPRTRLPLSQSGLLEQFRETGILFAPKMRGLYPTTQHVHEQENVEATVKVKSQLLTCKPCADEDRQGRPLSRAPFQRAAAASRWHLR